MHLARVALSRCESPWEVINSQLFELGSLLWVGEQDSISAEDMTQAENPLAWEGYNHVKTRSRIGDFGSQYFVMLSSFLVSSF